VIASNPIKKGRTHQLLSDEKRSLSPYFSLNHVTTRI
jgi:hypothetical protein